jgi:hypothetical protein
MIGTLHSLFMAASARPAAVAAMSLADHPPSQPASPHRRANRIHDNAATPYLTLVDELLDVVEDATPLPTDLIRLILGYADLEGYRVLPRGPIQLESIRRMPASMQRGAMDSRGEGTTSDVRWLSFQGGGSLVLSAPLFLPSAKKRKRLQVNPPFVQAHDGAAGAAWAAAAGGHHPEQAAAIEAPALVPASTTYDVSLVPSAEFRKCASSWHVEPLLLGAHALTFTAERGWIVGVETTLRRSLLDKTDTHYARLTVNSPPPFILLHARRFKYYRTLPYGLNLIADTSQPPARIRRSGVISSLEEAASAVVRGHEKDNETVGITLVYAGAMGETRVDVMPPKQLSARGSASTVSAASDAASDAAASPFSSSFSTALTELGQDSADTCSQHDVCVTRFFQVATPSRSLTREDLLTGARAFFRGVGQCEYGESRCRERVDAECFSSCCSAEHCAQVNGGEPCASH